ncbi:hypothetical protein BJ965_000222 [Streptomyces luteogriseus]|uniref:Uncharacterized protein n=1 Tax=Streptomyces luteogriseus TaxID=68233 RepID=A0A7W7DIJ3_9ACTN|nr:hypothetical protein [Streptomyces luteogriseus]
MTACRTAMIVTFTNWPPSPNMNPTARRAGTVTAAFQRAVASHELVARHQSYERRLVRHVEEHGQGADGEGEREQAGHAQQAGEAGRGHSAQGQGAAAVREHHRRAGAPPVHPRAGEERQQQDGCLPHGTEDAQLAGTGVECQDGQERQDHQACVFPELGGRLPHPESAEVGVPPQAGRSGPTGMRFGGGSGRHGHPLSRRQRGPPPHAREVRRRSGQKRARCAATSRAARDDRPVTADNVNARSGHRPCDRSSWVTRCARTLGAGGPARKVAPPDCHGTRAHDV